MFENNVMDRTFPENLYFDTTGDELNNAPDDCYATLMYAVYRFPRNKAEIVLMRYRDGLSYRAIGEKCNLSGARVEAIVSECVEKLQTKKQLLTMGVEKAMTVTDESNKVLRDELQKRVEQINAIDCPAEVVAAYESFPLEELDLTARSYNGLARCGIATVADIIRSGNDIMHIPHLGRKSLSEIVQKLYDIGVDVKKYFNRIIIELNLDFISR